MCFPTRHMKYSMYNNHFFAINDVTNISRLKSTASQRPHTQTLLFLNMHTFSTFNRNMGENIYIASPPAEERSIELSDSTLPHCRNNLEMKNMSIRGTQWSHAVFFSPQWKAEVVFFLFILSTFTSAPLFFPAALFMPRHCRNQAAGQRGVPPGLPRRETMESNKWQSSYAPHLCYDSVHRRVFLRREHIELKWAAGQKVPGVLSQRVTVQSLINDLLTSGGILWNGTERENTRGVHNTEVQRLEGLRLIFLLWISNK